MKIDRKIQEEIDARTLRSILGRISDTSLLYSKINRKIPFDVAIEEDKIIELKQIYIKIIKELFDYLKLNEDNIYGKDQG